MRPERSYFDYLRDILQAAEETLWFVQGMDYLAFAADRRTILAVVRALEIIGEAARRIPARARRRHPRVPWQEVQHPVRGPQLVQSAPWKLSGTPAIIRSAGPLLGQHNHQVLQSGGGFTRACPYF